MPEVRASSVGASPLADLAELYGVVPSYVAVSGETRTASPEALLPVLAALGAPVARPEDAGRALRERRRELALRLLEPVTVLWEGEARGIRPRLSPSEAGARIDCRLETEDGGTREWTERGDRIAVPDDVGLGYHALSVTVGGRRSAATRLLVAPATLHDPEARAWGAFLPLYALRTRRAWGTADFTDLERLLEWTAALGGRAVGTLPLFATFLSQPFDPSPYAPVSRLFWNELYVDVEREAGAHLDDSELQARIASLRRAPLVNYREAYALKRRLLEGLSDAFFRGRGATSEDYARWLAEHPEAEAYARFRAAGEVHDGSEDAARFHLYSQYRASRQIEAVAESARERDVALHLDLPLGVHPDGFDAWRWQELFVEGFTAGAPPDDFFAGGQDWGFRPLHPERIREDGHGYFVRCIRHLFRHAGLARLDHVMGLHRLYWVPAGAPATEGTYVRYPADELWAILCIESRRWRTAVVGEDLGTVPGEVREIMARRAARRMYVLPFELRDEGRLEPVPERSVASLGTHDTPTFAAWWRSAGEPRRRALRQALRRADHAPDGAADDDGARAALRASLAWLAESPERLLLVNLEDLWLEQEPQNEPGTSVEERPNWRRKARHAFEEFSEMAEVVDILRDVDRRRKEGT